MPKVSDSYREERRDQILRAAGRCFVRNGFQATSMQDLFAESGLSSGSFYLYFASKDEIIVAIAEHNLQRVASLIHELATAPKTGGLGEALASVIDRVRTLDRDEQLGVLAVISWSEAMRSTELRQHLVAAVERIQTDLAEVVVGYQATGDLPAGVGAAALTTLISAIVPGLILQMAVLGDAAVDGVEDAARALWPAPTRARRSSKRPSVDIVVH